MNTAEKEEVRQKAKAEATVEKEVDVLICQDLIRGRAIEEAKVEKVVEALICRGLKGGRGSWSRRGLYWHAPAGAVRSHDCGYAWMAYFGGSSNPVPCLAFYHV